MPKRSYDTADMMLQDGTNPPAKVQKASQERSPRHVFKLANHQQSGRSHEENQERAYIAASRRNDRSLEARVQSAMMASDIHKRRTGRALKVSEEIVKKEEMYEEVEDDMPRAYRNLTAHLQTGEPELDRRVNAYVATRAATSAAAAKYHEINRLFNEAFPRNHSFSAYAPTMFNGFSDSPSSPVVSQQAPSKSLSAPATRNPSISTQSPYLNVDTAMPTMSPTTTPTTVSVPTPGLSPASAATDAAESIGAPRHMSASPYTNMPLDPQLLRQASHAFTPELSNEVKMMASIDMNDPMAMQFFGGDPPCGYPMFDQFDDMSFMQFTTPEQGDFNSVPPNEMPANPPGDRAPPDTSRFGTPNYGSGTEGWESLVDFGTES